MTLRNYRLTGIAIIGTCTVLPLLALATLAPTPERDPTWSAVLTLKTGAEYRVAHNVTLRTCLAIVADMTQDDSRCEQAR